MNYITSLDTFSKGSYFQLDTTTTIIFIILSFTLGFVVIMQKDKVPPHLRRFIALTSILFIAFSFFLIVYSLTTMGS